MVQFIINPFTGKPDAVSTSGIPMGDVTELTGNSGGAITPTAGNINILGDNASGLNTIGVLGNSTVTIFGLPSSTSQVGTTAFATNSIAAGQVSNIVALTPSNITSFFSTTPLPVSQGGTGDASFTAYSVIAGGTSSTSPLQSVSGLGSSGQVLTSNGAAALPTWQTASAGITGTTTQYDVIVGAGTSLVGSVGPGTAGQVLQSGGNAANPVYSTATYPSTVTAGDIIVATGTNAVGSLAIDTRYGATLASNGTAPYYQDPLQYVYWYEDFLLSPTAATVWYWSPTTASGLISYTNGVSTAANPGCVQLSTSSSTSGAAQISTQASGSSGNIVIGGGLISMTFVHSITTLSGSGDTFSVNVGLGTASNNAPSNGIYFSYTDTVNSGNWVINCGNGTTTATNTSTAPSAGVFTRYRIDINAAASSVTFYINDISQGSIATHIPTGTHLSPFFNIVKTGGSNARTLYVDFFSFYQALTTSR